MSSPPPNAVRELPFTEQPLQRLMHNGAYSLSVIELLAAILGGQDALTVAGEIVRRFGLARLRTLSVGELRTLNNVGPARAARIVAGLELCHRLFAQSINTVQISNPGVAARQLTPQMNHLEQEHLVVLILNQKYYVIDTVWLYKGSINSSVVRVAEVFREAVRQQGAAILVAHNHPSGDPNPSPEDIRVTRNLRRTGELLDIELLDHIIIGKSGFVSMKERELGF